MRAWWACKDIMNFGDVMTSYIIERLTGEVPEYSNEDSHVLMCGSVLDQSDENSIVLGAGFMRHDNDFAGAADIPLVRGLLSLYKLQRMGYASNAMVGDPALIMPMLYKPNMRKRHRVGLVPNYIDYDLSVNEYSRDFDSIIDVTQPIERVIDSISECKLIVSSSLHGIIIAHAYGIPAAWVQLSDNVAGDGFKYRDYIMTNAPQMPMYASSIKSPIFALGDHRNKELVYQTIKDTLDVFAAQ